ncbi:hypothetical protein F5B20DRAFT_577828 [Whalleya microplaca]|nr:hypothetical protein F5B20DRAFT_577828 [Whalleya microplaca]
MAATTETKEPKALYSTDPALYIYTSLTAGSSHIVTATSRLETILRANRVPFKAIDIATDEKARMLWGRRAGKAESGRVRKLPGLVQMGIVLGDLVEIEEWNEYGELKQHVTIYYDDFTIPTKAQAPPPPAPKPAKAAAPGAKAAAAAANKKAAASASKGTPAPAAPPLPESTKSVGRASSTASKKSTASTASKATNASKESTPSIAEEAAKRAKQVHLNSLRQKVYGNKGDGKDKGKGSDASSTKSKTSSGASDTSSVRESLDKMSISDKKAAGAAALQSPTTGSWKGGVPSEENLRPVLQSPNSSTWKTGDAAKESPGSEAKTASKKDAAATKKAEASPEASSSDEEDSEDDDDEEESSEEESSEEDVSKNKAKEKK